MNNVLIQENKKIESMIYEIRGKQVMLDSDLAILYQCKNGTKTINQAVSRNKDRFPKDFYFQLSENEINNWRSQIGTAYDEIKSNYRNKRFLPYVFTEQGVAMLATVIKTPIASQMSVSIMRAFITIRKYISSNLIQQNYINNLVIEDHERIKILEKSLDKFEQKRKNYEIYFAGQIYDAYSKILEIFKTATKKLVIVDGYADNTLLDIVKKLAINVVIITKQNNMLTKQDIIMYNKQYNNLIIKYDNTFHDRYFILDDNIVYHCGASINRLGYKTFSITLIGDNDLCQLLINKINKIQKEENK